MSAITASLDLVAPEQGVCPEGHQCFTVNTEGPNGTVRRACVAGEYTGMPVIRDDITVQLVARAAVAGAELDLIEWVANTMEDRREDAACGVADWCPTHCTRH